LARKAALGGVKKWLTVLDCALTTVPPPKVSVEIDFIAVLLARDKDFLYQEYVVKQKSAKQIARENDWSHTTVAKYLLEFGLPPRSEGLPHHPKGNAPYGARIIKGVLIPHKGEQEVVGQLLAMRAAGKSYGDIVGWLNENGVKTKQGGKWDRPTVYKIVQRYNSVPQTPAD